MDFFGVIDDSVPTGRVLLLFTYRPGHAPAFGERSWHVRLTLRPLATTHGARIARALLGVDRLPDELANLLARKTDALTEALDFHERAQCAAGETDVHGCQQHVPLMTLPVPLEGNYSPPDDGGTVQS